VRKKLKQPSFAAGVHRDEVYAGAELLELELDEHIANVIESLRPIAHELGLRTGRRPPPARLRGHQGVRRPLDIGKGRTFKAARVASLSSAVAATA
jgi:hypothetical protein